MSGQHSNFYSSIGGSSPSTMNMEFSRHAKQKKDRVVRLRVHHGAEMKKFLPPTVENGLVRWRVVGGNTIYAAFSSQIRTTATLVEYSLPMSATFTGGRPLCHTRPEIIPPRSYRYRLHFALFSFGYTQHIAELW